MRPISRRMLLAAIAPLIAMCASGGGSPAEALRCSVSGPRGDVELELRVRDLPVDSSILYQKVQVIAREPKSGLTIWANVGSVAPGPIERFLHVDQHRGSAIVAAGSDRLVRITVGGLSILVHESRQRYRNLDAAESAIARAAKIPPTVRYVVTTLDEHFERYFFDQPDRSNSVGPRLASLRPSNGNWLLELKGDNGRTATVTLDSEYRVTNVQTVPIIGRQPFGVVEIDPVSVVVDGKTYHAAVLSRFDTATAQLWYALVFVSKPPNLDALNKEYTPWLTFASDGKTFVAFEIKGGRLLIRRDTIRAATAKAARAELIGTVAPEKVASAYATSVFPADAISLDINEILGHDFVDPTTQERYDQPQILSIEVVEGEWRLEIRNRKGTRRVMRLDREFAPIIAHSRAIQPGVRMAVGGTIASPGIPARRKAAKGTVMNRSAGQVPHIDVRTITRKENE